MPQFKPKFNPDNLQKTLTIMYWPLHQKHILLPLLLLISVGFGFGSYNSFQFLFRFKFLHSSFRSIPIPTDILVPADH